MAGLTYNIAVSDTAALQALKNLHNRGRNTLPLMKQIAEVAVSSVQENFEKGGRPRWAPLAASTIKRKGHARPLIFRGQLMRVSRKVSAMTVLIGVQPNTRAYAARQHFGWPGTGSRAGGKVKTPARPFMKLQREDEREIADLVERFYTKVLSQR